MSEFSNTPADAKPLTEESLDQLLAELRAQMARPLAIHPTKYIVTPEIWQLYDGDEAAIRRDIERLLAGLDAIGPARKP
jgi:hypothetical protein